MSNLNDFVSKPKEKFKPKFDSNGIRIETAEEIENWKRI
jgi:hypothetical protein